MEAKRRDAAPQAVWPCRLRIIAAFCKRDPIILGVDILDGTLRVGTPICVVKTDPATQVKEIVDLGKVYVVPYTYRISSHLLIRTSLEINHKPHEVGGILKILSLLTLIPSIGREEKSSRWWCRSQD